ncbi:predicted protein [Naegleria gruberi]|uniref:Predicted protein n=1 Tax=Naegleria gruberi TaxID=5762 RepID=D2VGI9_NAEGR|nr:uncharacterized protein NAEGRDRAFT_49354 [Naegleria gruberi]EFC44074.1 predicted protein [Naegleria gruberi]|eukprot:XP_002676818.1 predicted protein [Naegleria gruberi strain NEG-M]
MSSTDLKSRLRELKQQQQVIQVKEQEYKDKNEEFTKDVQALYESDSEDEEDETSGVEATTTEVTSEDMTDINEEEEEDKKPFFQNRKEEAVTKIAALFENLKSSRNIGQENNKDGKQSGDAKQGVDFSNTIRTFVIRKLPHGFYEEEVTKFFSQVGTVINVRVPRSKNTGHPLNKAYVQMEDPEIAKMIVETFDYYLLNDRVIRVSMLDGDNPLARQKQIFKFKKEDAHSSILENGVAAQLKKQQKLICNLARGDSSKISKKTKKNQKEYLRKIRNKLQKKLKETSNK